MSVNPILQSMLTQMNTLLPVFDENTDIDALRAPMLPESTLASKLKLGSVKDLSISLDQRDVAIRVYRPDNAASPLPLLVYFHGGGWVLGSLDSHDAVCRILCDSTNAVVVSVDYRLAPEHPFPAAVHDGFDVLAWCQQNAQQIGVDPNKIAVIGDSAGGNLAAVMALKARDETGPSLCAQVLIYPVTDTDFTRPSYVDNAEGYFLTTAAMQWFWDKYTGDGSDRNHPYAAPIKASLDNLPPAMVITAGYDPLRDEGIAYAEKLKAAGVEVSERAVDDAIHGFIGFSDFYPAAREVLAEISNWLNQCFNKA